MTVQDIYPKVAAIVADVLVIDESEVDLKKRLVADLGAESIDFLDLVFQLEGEFDITIPRGKLESDARAAMQGGEFEKDGVITAEGMTALKNYLSEVPDEYFTDNLKVDEIPTLFTVETFCKFVLREQAAQKEEVKVN